MRFTTPTTPPPDSPTWMPRNSEAVRQLLVVINFTLLFQFKALIAIRFFKILNCQTASSLRGGADGAEELYGGTQKENLN